MPDTDPPDPTSDPTSEPTPEPETTPATEPTPVDTPPDLGKRQEDRARRFVRICAAVLLVALGLGSCVMYSFIPSIDRDPVTVRAALSRLAGDLSIPEGFEPMRAVSINPFLIVPGESVVFEGPGGSALVASLYKGAQEPPQNATLELADERTETIAYMGEDRPVRIGTIPNPPIESEAVRAATTWIRTSEGVLQVTLSQPESEFDEAAALATLKTIGR